METKPLPSPERQEHSGTHPYIILALIFIVLVWVLVFTVGIGLSRGPWASWWALISLGAFTAVLTGVIVAHEKHKAHQLHKQDVEDRKHHRTMVELAIRGDHSAEHITATSSLRTVSKFMGPASSITIKDNQMGQLGQALPTAPTFREIIPQVRPGHFFLAQGANGAIWGDITDLLSTLNIGRPGTGKSTLLRDVTGQLLAIDGKPLIFDPHGSILDDLGTHFDCAESPREIVDASRFLEQTLDRRLIARRAGVRQFQPLLLMVDEMPVIFAQAKDCLPVIKRIVSEGRKVLMFAIISGVGCPAEILGGTIVRDAMASRYIFMTTTVQASRAGVDAETSKPLLAQLEEAGPGKAILARAGYKAELVAIPNTTTEDIRLLVPGEFPASSQPVPETDNLSNGNQDGNYPEPENETLALVRAMVLDHKGMTEIAFTAFPGMRKEEALKEVRRYLARLVSEAS